MTSVSKNVYSNKLDNIVNKCNHTYHNTIKIKPDDVKSSTYIDFDKKNSKEDPKFKVSYHVKISNYENIFEKGCISNWSEKVFVIIKVKNTVPWTYVISDLKGEKLVECLMKKNCKIKSKRI